MSAAPPSGKPSRFKITKAQRRPEPEPEPESVELDPADVEALDEYENLLQTLENTSEQMNAFAVRPAESCSWRDGYTHT